MMKRQFFSSCILLLCCFLANLRAQDTAFWFVAPHMSETIADNVPLNRPAFLAITNGTFQTAHVTITRYNGTNPSLVTDIVIPPDSLYKLDFSTDADMKTVENPRSLAGSVTEFGLHIRSDVKITAYYMHNHTGSRDIFTLKGRQALGTEFYVPMQSDNAARSSDPAVGNYQGQDQVDIVATENATRVTVVPGAKIRIGTSASSPAGDTVRHTLNRGETLKIMEYSQDEYPSLAGTKITSDKPVAVTVTEDLVAGDTSGDQIVPVSSLGTRYIVPRGFLTNTTHRPERFYLVGTKANTTADIYATPGAALPDTTLLLHRGDIARYTFPSPATYAVYVEASEPVYVYQRSGYGEEGAALLPGIYAIGQTRLTFYHVYVALTPPSNNKAVQWGFLIFRNGAESGFTVSYGAAPPLPLTLTPLDIPNVPDWKIARFEFQKAPAGGETVKIRSEKSAFSLGYITGLSLNNDSYGYFSAFGEFNLPDTTYICASSVTLEGGYAKSYKWLLNGDSIADTPSITASEEGEYVLEMNQDPNIVKDTTRVLKVAGGHAGAAQLICAGTPPAELTVSGASQLPALTCQWQFNDTDPNNEAAWANIPGATSPSCTPGPLRKTTWFRRGITLESCAAYTNAVKIEVSPCTVPVNPHLRSRAVY